MSVTLLGGAGFVGLNLAEALVARGRGIRILDRSPVPDAARARLGAGIAVILGDVGQAEALTEAIPPGTDAVVYGAAITAGRERDAREPEAILAVNLAGLVPVLRRAAAVGVRRVVLLSSASAYGAAAFRDDPLDESGPVDPESLYAVTKFAGERVAARLGALWGLDVRAVRLSAVYGPWERATGVRDSVSPHAQVLAAARAGEPALLPRPGLRDWLYAPDAAAGILALVDAPQPAHALYNLSTPILSTVLDFGEALDRHRPGLVCRLAEPGETPTIDLHADRDRAPLATARLAQDLDWRAAYDVEAAVADLMARGVLDADP